MAKGMSTGTKVALGVGVLAVAGGIGYYFWKRKQDPAVTDEQFFGTDSTTIRNRINSGSSSTTPVFSAPGAEMRAASLIYGGPGGGAN